MAYENEALFLQRAVRAKVLDPDKGTAALMIYSQLRQMGAQFEFGDFLVERGLISNMALSMLKGGGQVQSVSTVGDYQLLELLGEGQNGAVFLALQQSLQRQVALKILNADLAADPDCVKRFLNEARATARLNHPNIVQGIDVGTAMNLHYFAMEYVDGGSASTLRESAGGQLGEKTTVEIVRQCAEGLKAAHAAGIQHRDIKPDNILLTKDGQVKIADLGISQLGAVAEGGEGAFWASPPYAAPEVIQGLAENDPRSDVYSLGATFFELLAGQPPYEAQSPHDVLNMHLTEPIPDLAVFRPDILPHTVAVVTAMLQKDPERRLQSAAAVAQAAAEILGVLETAPKKVRRPAPAPAALKPLSGPVPMTGQMPPKVKVFARKQTPRAGARPLAQRPGRPGAPRSQQKRRR